MTSFTKLLIPPYVVLPKIGPERNGRIAPKDQEGFIKGKLQQKTCQEIGHISITRNALENGG
jgi:hypothetical protein